MPELIYALIELVAGGAVVWLIMHFRTKGVVQQKVSETEARARGAESAVIELRNQATALLGELQSARAQLDTEGKKRVAAETQLEETRKSLEEQRKLLEEATARLTDTFKALSSDALRGNTEQFVRKTDDVLKPLKETLARYETALQEMNQNREGGFKGLTAHIENLLKANQALEQQTGKLASALRAPTIRGKWGEIMLERVLELSGLGKECVEKQPTVASDGGALRPDVVVRLPGERCIVVDAKVPLNAYMEAMETEDADTREKKLADHAGAIRSHVRQLATKGYWKEYDESPDLVVMFLPAESFLSAALSVDPALIEDSLKNRVILATPTALVVTLSAVAYSWQQQKVTENVREIAKAGTDLYGRLCTFAGHLDDIRDGIDKAAGAYERAVCSWKARVEPGARRLKQLDAAAMDRELPALEPPDSSLRQLPPAEDGNEETRNPDDDSSPKPE